MAWGFRTHRWLTDPGPPRPTFSFTLLHGPCNRPRALAAPHGCSRPRCSEPFLGFAAHSVVFLLDSFLGSSSQKWGPQVGGWTCSCSQSPGLPEYGRSEGWPARPALHFLREMAGLALSPRADYCSPEVIPGCQSKQGPGDSTPSSGTARISGLTDDGFSLRRSEEVRKPSSAPGKGVGESVSSSGTGHRGSPEPQGRIIPPSFQMTKGLWPH